MNKKTKSTSFNFNPAFKQTQPDVKLTRIKGGVMEKPHITIHNKERCTRAYSNKISILKKAFVTMFDETDSKKFKQNKVNLGKAFYWCFWGGNLRITYKDDPKLKSYICSCFNAKSLKKYKRAWFSLNQYICSNELIYPWFPENSLAFNNAIKYINAGMIQKFYVKRQRKP